MRKFFLFILFAFLCGESFSQNANAIFATYSFSNPEPVYNRAVDGGAGYKGVVSSTFGLRYLAKSSKIITLETGVDYSLFKYKLSYVDHPAVVIPDITRTMKVISVPIYARLTFLRYLFANGGLILDAEIGKKRDDIDRQSGIGMGLGIGGQYHFKKINVSINPFFERHGFIGLEREDSGTRQSIVNPGIRFGIGYSF